MTVLWPYFLSFLNEDESTAVGIHLDIPQMGYVWKLGYEIKSCAVKGWILLGFWDFSGFCGGENVVRLWWIAW
jgi:hypothetical protein